MKASSHEKHSKQQWKKKKVQTHGQGLGRGLAGYMGLNCFFFCFFGFSMVFCSLAKTSRTPKKKTKKKSDPWARSGLSTHKPKNQKNKKTRNQKNKKTKKQKNKKPKKQKIQKKQKDKTQHSASDPLPLGCAILFFFCFFGFLVFWFLVFLVFWFVCGEHRPCPWV